MLLLTNGVELWLYSTGLSLNSVIIIIIIIFRQQSGPDRPVSAAPSKAFQVAFVHSICHPAAVPSCYMSQPIRFVSS